MKAQIQQHIQLIVTPLLNRIQTLEKCNQELTLRVKHLELLLSPEKNYHKMTVSAANHMKESRISNTSPSHRPSWNSKTKVEQSPIKASSPPPLQKVKTKPPIPKTAKSPLHRGSPSQIKSSLSQKRIVGGTKIQSADNSQTNKIEDPPHQEQKVKGDRNIQRMNDTDASSQKKQLNNQLQNKSVKKNMNFQQLIKHNNQIIESMKHSSDQLVPPSNANYVTKAQSPRSEYHLSSTTSPQQRSFASDKQHLNNNTTQM